MNTDQMLTNIKDAKSSSDKSLLSDIKTLEQRRHTLYDQHRRLEMILPKLTQAFKNERLEVTEFNFRFNEDYQKWNLSFHLNPQGRSHKPIKFKGYTASGEDKNRQKLYKKSKKFDDAITQQVNLPEMSVRSNMYSFEYENGNKNRDIFVDIQL